MVPRNTDWSLTSYKQRQKDAPFLTERERGAASRPENLGFRFSNTHTERERERVAFWAFGVGLVLEVEGSEWGEREREGKRLKCKSREISESHCCNYSSVYCFFPLPFSPKWRKGNEIFFFLFSFFWRLGVIVGGLQGVPYKMLLYVEWWISYTSSGIFPSQIFFFLRPCLV